jgi:hypothetical protein
MTPVIAGVTMHLAAGDKSFLLDTTPETAGFDDAPLASGQTFVDTRHNISIRTLSVDEGGAQVAISFSGNLPTAAAAPAADDPGVGGTGLDVQYFAGKDEAGSPLATALVPAVDFDWQYDTPDPAVPVDGFSAHFHGFVTPAVSGTYVFSTSSDDGVRLSVNGEMIIDDWTDHGIQGDVGQVDLVAGQPAEISMDYYENSGTAVARLAWQPPGRSCEIVPQDRLSPENNGGGDPPPTDDPPPGGSGPDGTDGGKVFGGCSAGGGGSSSAAGLVLLIALLVRTSAARRRAARARR